VTGAFSTTASFSQKTLTSVGGTDIFLAKYDQTGKLLWLIQAGGSGDDQGFDIAFDNLDNVYTTGQFSDSATFHGTSGKAKTVTGAGEAIYLAKYTSTGKIVWIQTGVASFGSNAGYGVAVEPVVGSVYITGVTTGDTRFSSVSGTLYRVPGVGLWHMFLVKYDIDGNFRWGETNEASINTVAHKVAVDPSRNVYATGWMEGQTTFHSRDGHDQTVVGFSQPVQSYPDFPGDAYVVKYDSHGILQWVNHVGGYKGVGTDVATSPDGKVSITGFIGNVSDSPEQASTVVTSQPGGQSLNLGGGIFTVPFNRDAFVATWDGQGVLLDARRYGGTLDDGASGIAYDRQGNLTFAGEFGSQIKIEGQTLTGNDPTSLFVVRFFHSDKQCRPGQKTNFADRLDFAPHKLDWTKSADGAGVADLENNSRIALTSDGGVWVTGTYGPTARFDSFRLISAGEEDGFLAELK
jgi:hypothetical protein